MSGSYHIGVKGLPGKGWKPQLDQLFAKAIPSVVVAFVIVMKYLPLLLLVTVAAFGHEEESCQTPIEQYGESVESMLRLPEGFSVSWLDKHVSRLGDDAAVVLIRLGAPENLKNSSDIKKVLNILRLAFDCPPCVEHAENRTSGVTMLFLDMVDARTQEKELKEQVRQTGDYIRAQLEQGNSHTDFPPRVSASEMAPLVVIAAPTIIAFFPVTKTELKKSPDSNEGLSDFQLFASQVRGPLKEAGIEFQEVYGEAFRVRIGQNITAFRPAKENAGYYLITPGKKPRVEYGVMTDTDLLRVAKEYFGTFGK